MQLNVQKSIQLTTKPLDSLIQRGEALDFRLDEESWRDLKPGDQIEFWEDFTGWQTEPMESSRKVIVRIEHIYKGANFPDLFRTIENEISDLGSKDELLAELRRWWDRGKEIQQGVLAFHVVLIRQ